MSGEPSTWLVLVKVREELRRARTRPEACMVVGHRFGIPAEKIAELLRYDEHGRSFNVPKGRSSHG